MSESAERRSVDGTETFRTVRSSEAGPLRVAVLISGGGSNLAAVLTACQTPDYGVDVVMVGADRPSAGGLRLAQDAGIPTSVVRVREHPDRAAWDEALTETLAAHDPGLVVSAGFLKLVGPTFLHRFAGRYLNTHNALLPSFPGIHGPADALRYGVKITGATLFFVDAGLDTGPILAQVAVAVEAQDTEDSLTERIKAAERQQLVEQLGRLARFGWTIKGRKVTTP